MLGCRVRGFVRVHLSMRGNNIAEGPVIRRTTATRKTAVFSEPNILTALTIKIAASVHFQIVNLEITFVPICFLDVVKSVTALYN